MQTTEGELYEAAGTLYGCDERLCPACLARRSREARRKAREAIQRAGRRKGEIPYFITLTVPKVTAAERGLLDSLTLLLSAWRLFTKRIFFTEHIRAAFKGCEFTIGDKGRLEDEAREWDAGVDGWHSHIHFIAIARHWIKAYDLRRAWTESYLSACEAAGYTPTINTKDGYLNCHLRYVTQGAKQATRGTVPLESAIQETCKYVTKFDSWLEIPEGQLLEVAGVERWPRMVEALGDCRRQRATKGTQLTREASGGEGAQPYLDTTDLYAGDSSPPEAQKLCRSLRELGRAMIEQGRRAEWLSLLGSHVRKAQEFRRGQLARKYPYAVFRTLDGRTWRGAAHYVDWDSDAQAEREREEWREVEAAADLSQQREDLQWQERERWAAYVEHGREVLTGSETVYDRMKWRWRNAAAFFDQEEYDQQQARAFAWSLSGKERP